MSESADKGRGSIYPKIRGVSNGPKHTPVVKGSNRANEIGNFKLTEVRARGNFASKFNELAKKYNYDYVIVYNEETEIFSFKKKSMLSKTIVRNNEEKEAKEEAKEEAKKILDRYKEQFEKLKEDPKKYGASCDDLCAELWEEEFFKEEAVAVNSKTEITVKKPTSRAPGAAGTSEKGTPANQQKKFTK